MRKIYEGKAWVFGSNIDTDQVYPAKFLEHTNPEEIAKHCLQGADPEFASKVQNGDIIVAGTNFGCGSSREHAVITLQSAGVHLLIAESFARIFYRNAINLALPLLVCPAISEAAQNADRVHANIESGCVTVYPGEQVLKAEPLTEHALKILQSGGIKNLMKAQIMDEKNLLKNQGLKKSTS